MTTYPVVIRVVRPIGAEQRGRIELATGVYPHAAPDGEPIYVTAQRGRIDGWHYHEWRDGQPVSVVLYVEVQ